MNIILLFFAIKYQGDWDKIYKALEEKEKVSLEEIEKTEKIFRESRYKIITILDLEYPNQLKQCYKPPFVIWTNKDLVLNDSLICVTGNQTDTLTQERIKDFVPEIIKNNYLISPNFKGVDKEIISKAKEKIIFVLAHGVEFSKEYIDKNFLTEYPLNLHPTRETFKNRNRIISSLANSLVIFSSLKDGKINDLISNFLNLGKEIYCFPGDGTDSDGNSDLIKQGANLITSIKDIAA